MQLKIWGVRGSIPTPGETTLRYGGNTPCVQVLVPDGPGLPESTSIVFDAGSGIRVLGNHLAEDISPEKELTVYLFLSHIHWDHIQGLPFFKPLYRANSHIHLHGPDYENMEEIIRYQMCPNHFPVSMDSDGIKSVLKFHPLEQKPIQIGSISVRHHFVNHGTEQTVVGYRAESPTGTVVYIPDVEPWDYPSGSLADSNGQALAAEKALRDFVRDADVMLFDSMFCDEEFETYRGWGHSPMEYAVGVAADAGVKKLGLFHHDPMRDDDDLDRLLVEMQKRGRASGVEVFASKEGMAIDIDAGTRQKVKT